MRQLSLSPGLAQVIMRVNGLESSLGNLFSSDQLATSDRHVRISLVLLTKISVKNYPVFLQWYVSMV